MLALRRSGFTRSIHSESANAEDEGLPKANMNHGYYIEAANALGCTPLRTGLRARQGARAVCSRRVEAVLCLLGALALAEGAAKVT